jgi:predicted transcriptional regulator
MDTDITRQLRAQGTRIVTSLTRQAQVTRQTHRYSHVRIVQAVLRELIEEDKTCQDLLYILVLTFKLSQTALRAHVKRMIDGGLVVSTGKTSNQLYEITNSGRILYIQNIVK